MCLGPIAASVGGEAAAGPAATAAAEALSPGTAAAVFSSGAQQQATALISNTSINRRSCADSSSYCGRRDVEQQAAATITSQNGSGHCRRVPAEVPEMGGACSGIERATHSNKASYYDAYYRHSDIQQA